jgi:O-antigen/teichoic acid export membrane protein
MWPKNSASLDEGSVTVRAGTVGVGRIVGVLSLFCVDLLLVRSLPQDTYGLYRQIWLIFNVASPIALLGTASSLLYFLPTLDSSRQTTFLTQTALLLLLTGGIIVFCLRVAAPFVADVFGAPQLSLYLSAFLPYVFAATAGGFLDPLLLATNRTVLYAVLVGSSGVALLTVVMFSVVFQLSLDQLLLMISGVGVIRMIVAYGYASGTGKIRPQGVTDWALLQEHLVYTGPIWLADIIGIASRWTDKVIVSSLFTTDQFAIYAIGATEIPFIGILLASMRAVLTPELTRRYHTRDIDGVLKEWHSGVMHTAMIVLPLFVFLLLFAQEVIPLIYTTKYTASVGPFMIYLLLLPVRAAFYGVVLIAIGRSGLLFWSAFGDFLLNAGLGAGLAYSLGGISPELGLLGPAIATVVSTYVEVVVLLYFIRRDLDVGWGVILPWRGLWRLMWVSLIGGIACLPFRLLLDDQPVILLSVGSVVFSGVVLWLNRRDILNSKLFS